MLRRHIPLQGVACRNSSCYADAKFSLEETTISSTIFIGNLSFDTTEDELRTVLVDVDAGVRVRLGTDRLTGKPRGFAFAQFADDARAADAIRRFDSFELRGRRLRVNDADDKPPPRAPRPMTPSTIAARPMEAFDPGDFGGGGMPPFRRNGGSRRGLRGKKRSLR